MITFLARQDRVTAALVELEGQRLYAVAIDGKAHLVAADVFELLYEPGNYVTKSPAVPKVAAKKFKPEAIVQDVTTHFGNPAKAKPTLGPVLQKALDTLREFGPLTAAELGTRLYPDKEPKKRMDSTSFCTMELRKRGFAEKREVDRLDKWVAL